MKASMLIPLGGIITLLTLGMFIDAGSQPGKRDLALAPVVIASKLQTSSRINQMSSSSTSKPPAWRFIGPSSRSRRSPLGGKSTKWDILK